MAFEIPDHYYRLFTSNVELLLQQKKPHFMGAVSQMSYSGEAAQVVKQFGTVEFQEKTARLEDTEFSDLEHKQRWIFPERLRPGAPDHQGRRDPHPRVDPVPLCREHARRLGPQVG
jgi:hypothetical protein